MPIMLYILDAYNVIHKSPRFTAALDRELREARESLTEACAFLKQTRGGISGFILVFDGRSEFRDLRYAAPLGVQLVFSETGESADERITELLETLPPKPDKCVVSDDNFVRNHARAFCAKSMSVAEFEALLDPSRGRKQSPTAGPEKNLPAFIASKITEEYRKNLGL